MNRTYPGLTNSLIKIGTRDRKVMGCSIYSYKRPDLVTKCDHSFFIMEDISKTIICLLENSTIYCLETVLMGTG